VRRFEQSDKLKFEAPGGAHIEKYRNPLPPEKLKTVTFCGIL
jgi:hypothetical protein